MEKMHFGSRILSSSGFLLLGWIALMVVLLAATAIYEHRRLLSEFREEAAVMHRLVSQRADQHDAHLTALSAIANAESGDSASVFLNVARTIQRFYPRIKAVYLVPLQSSEAVLSTGTGISNKQKLVIREAAEASDGRLTIRPAPDAPGHYLLIKRSPNNDHPRFGLALEVDGPTLLGMDSDFWSQPSVKRSLLLPDQSLVAGEAPSKEAQFNKRLSSGSQPLLLQAGMRPGLSDLLPKETVIPLIILSSLVYLASMLWLRQRVITRQAERQARISAQEVQLAHASRVNALGEMASGMAHELTQPLTAILSQAQAGRHLARREDAQAVDTVLQSIADQAKRGSAIIERLRNWSRPVSSFNSSVSIADVLNNVEVLLSTEARKNGVTISVSTETPALVVRGDQVELEQIIFNLVRNAIEAVEGMAEKQVNVSACAQGQFAVIDVTDTGPGVSLEIRERLFEPFATGKANGTGLGLTLCRRLSERMGGDISLLAGAQQTVFRVRIPLEQSNAGDPAR